MNFGKKIVIFSVMLLISNNIFAEGWCTLKDGFKVVTHGTKTDYAYILATLEGRTDGMWIIISDGNIGKANISIALAAQMAGKKLSIYLDSASESCETFKSWAPVGEIRHIRIL